MSVNTTIDFEPLDRWMHDHVAGMDDPGERGGVHSVLRKSEAAIYYRAKRSGRLTLASADKIAVALGHHPGEIWPTWFGMDIES